MPARIHWVNTTFTKNGPTITGDKPQTAKGRVDGTSGSRSLWVTVWSDIENRKGSRHDEIKIGFSEKFELEIPPGQETVLMNAKFEVNGIAQVMADGSPMPMGLIFTLFSPGGVTTFNTACAITDGKVTAKLLQGSKEVFSFNYPFRLEKWSKNLLSADNMSFAHRDSDSAKVDAKDGFELQVATHVMTKASIDAPFALPKIGRAIFQTTEAKSLVEVNGACVKLRVT